MKETLYMTERFACWSAGTVDVWVVLVFFGVGEVEHQEPSGCFFTWN